LDLGLSGTRALVTAASKGIGRACAASLAQEGARVVITSRDAALGARVAQEIGAERHIAADLARTDDRARIVTEAVGLLGGLDILVVNFPQPQIGTFESLRPEAWTGGYEAILHCQIDLVTAALPLLRQSGRGRIVHITGGAAREPSPGFVVSAAFRSAATAVAKTLSIDLARDGVTVNNIAPGSIETEQLRVRMDQRGKAEEMAWLATLPSRRLGLPEEVGAVCAFLCSRPAAYLTGQTIAVDGGAQKSV